MSCDACMKRFLRTFAGAYPVTTATPRSRLLTGYINPNLRRQYAVTSITSAENGIGKIGTENDGAYPDRGSSALTAREQSSKGLEEKEQLPRSKGVIPHDINGKPFSKDEFLVRKHLQYLKDPLKLADFVRDKLRSGEFNEAQTIVRAASRDVQCTVSWNHLIDYLLSQGRMNTAIKTYHEMKKRAQQPDSHTYTIIFRGCALHRNPTQALAKAMSIYHSMFAQNSLVKPNTIHMNAMLKMCAKAQDIDALFGIAAQMPETGLRAPNNLSYTTIFNALRMYTTNDQRSNLTPAQKEHNRQKVILDARRMWSDITNSWRKGAIWVDEELVCAMGRILLMGGERDWDDVFSLLEQTMNIPRQFPSPGASVPSSIEAPGDFEKDLSQGTISDLPKSSKGSLEAKEEHSVLPVDESGSTGLTGSQSNGSSAYAKPGQNTLSLVMEALLKLRMKRPADQYWDILVNGYKVKPDAENFHGYLRILRRARASTQVVDIIQQMSLNDMQAKTFRIAMSACERDKNNPNAFANAGKTLDLMARAIEVPDITALITYLQVAVSAATQPENKSTHSQLDLTKYEQGRQILRALQRLNPFFLNLKSYATYGDPPKLGSRLPTADVEFVDSFQRLVRRIIGAMDLLMNKGLVQQGMYRGLDIERRKLTAFITRLNHVSARTGSAAKDTRKHIIGNRTPDLSFTTEQDGPELTTDSSSK